MNSALFAASLAFATALALLGLAGVPSPAHAAGPSFSIDAGIDGNSATAVGKIENCVAVKTGDRFQMDIVVQDISDLLAWEIPIDYKPAVVTVVDQDVKLFQQANANSSVLDLSARLPDDSGFHAIAAFDSADPASPDSGSGVLARVTFEAVGAGDSPIRFGNRDYDSNGMLDRGSLIRDKDTNIIGDSNKDTYFDGARNDAEVVVDGNCPSGSVVAKASTVSQPTANTSGGSSFPWMIVSGGVAGGIAVLGAAVILLSRRRGSRRRSTLDA